MEESGGERRGILTQMRPRVNSSEPRRERGTEASLMARPGHTPRALNPPLEAF